MSHLGRSLLHPVRLTHTTTKLPIYSCVKPFSILSKPLVNYNITSSNYVLYKVSARAKTNLSSLDAHSKSLSNALDSKEVTFTTKAASQDPFDPDYVSLVEEYTNITSLPVPPSTVENIFEHRSLSSSSTLKSQTEYLNIHSDFFHVEKLQEDLDLPSGIFDNILDPYEFSSYIQSNHMKMNPVYVRSKQPLLVEKDIYDYIHEDMFSSGKPLEGAALVERILQQETVYEQLSSPLTTPGFHVVNIDPTKPISSRRKDEVLYQLQQEGSVNSTTLSQSRYSSNNNTHMYSRSSNNNNSNNVHSSGKITSRDPALFGETFDLTLSLQTLCKQRSKYLQYLLLQNSTLILQEHYLTTRLEQLLSKLLLTNQHTQAIKLYNEMKIVYKLIPSVRTEVELTRKFIQPNLYEYVSSKRKGVDKPVYTWLPHTIFNMYMNEQNRQMLCETEEKQENIFESFTSPRGLKTLANVNIHSIPKISMQSLLHYPCSYIPHSVVGDKPFTSCSDHFSLASSAELKDNGSITLHIQSLVDKLLVPSVWLSITNTTPSLPVVPETHALTECVYDQNTVKLVRSRSHYKPSRYMNIELETTHNPLVNGIQLATGGKYAMKLPTSVLDPNGTILGEDSDMSSSSTSSKSSSTSAYTTIYGTNPELPIVPELSQLVEECIQGLHLPTLRTQLYYDSQDPVYRQQKQQWEMIHSKLTPEEKKLHARLPPGVLKLAIYKITNPTHSNTEKALEVEMVSPHINHGVVLQNDWGYLFADIHVERAKTDLGYFVQMFAPIFLDIGYGSVGYDPHVFDNGKISAHIESLLTCPLREHDLQTMLSVPEHTSWASYVEHQQSVLSHQEHSHSYTLDNITSSGLKHDMFSKELLAVSHLANEQELNTMMNWKTVFRVRLLSYAYEYYRYMYLLQLQSDVRIYQNRLFAESNTTKPSTSTTKNSRNASITTTNNNITSNAQEEDALELPRSINLKKDQYTIENLYSIQACIDEIVTNLPMPTVCKKEYIYILNTASLFAEQQAYGMDCTIDIYQAMMDICASQKWPDVAYYILQAMNVTKYQILPINIRFSSIYNEYYNEHGTPSKPFTPILDAQTSKGLQKISKQTHSGVLARENLNDKLVHKQDYQYYHQQPLVYRDRLICASQMIDSNYQGLEYKHTSQQILTHACYNQPMYLPNLLPYTHVHHALLTTEENLRNLHYAAYAVQLSVPPHLLSLYVYSCFQGQHPVHNIPIWMKERKYFEDITMFLDAQASNNANNSKKKNKGSNTSGSVGSSAMSSVGSSTVDSSHMFPLRLLEYIMTHASQDEAYIAQYQAHEAELFSTNITNDSTNVLSLYVSPQDVSSVTDGNTDTITDATSTSTTTTDTSSTSVKIGGHTYTRAKSTAKLVEERLLAQNQNMNIQGGVVQNLLRNGIKPNTDEKYNMTTPNTVFMNDVYSNDHIFYLSVFEWLHAYNYKQEALQVLCTLFIRKHTHCEFIYTSQALYKGIAICIELRDIFTLHWLLEMIHKEYYLPIHIYEQIAVTTGKYLANVPLRQKLLHQLLLFLKCRVNVQELPKISRVMYNAVLESCTTSNDAIRVLIDMEKWHVRPNIYSFTKLSELFAKEGKHVQSKYITDLGVVRLHNKSDYLGEYHLGDVNTITSTGNISHVISFLLDYKGSMTTTSSTNTKTKTGVTSTIGNIALSSLDYAYIMKTISAMPQPDIHLAKRTFVEALKANQVDNIELWSRYITCFRRVNDTANVLAIQAFYCLLARLPCFIPLVLNERLPNNTNYVKNGLFQAPILPLNDTNIHSIPQDVQQTYIDQNIPLEYLRHSYTHQLDRITKQYGYKLMDYEHNVFVNGTDFWSYDKLEGKTLNIPPIPLEVVNSFRTYSDHYYKLDELERKTIHLMYVHLQDYLHYYYKSVQARNVDLKRLPYAHLYANIPTSTLPSQYIYTPSSGLYNTGDAAQAIDTIKPSTQYSVGELHMNEYSIFQRCLLNVPKADTKFMETMIKSTTSISPFHSLSIFLWATYGLTKYQQYINHISTNLETNTYMNTTNNNTSTSTSSTNTSDSETDSATSSMMDTTSTHTTDHTKRHTLPSLQTQFEEYVQNMSIGADTVMNLMEQYGKTKSYGLALHLYTLCEEQNRVSSATWIHSPLRLKFVGMKPHAAVVLLRLYLHRLYVQYKTTGELPTADLLIQCGYESSPDVLLQESLQFNVPDYVYRDKMTFHPTVVLVNNQPSSYMKISKQQLNTFIQSYEKDGKCLRVLASMYACKLVTASVKRQVSNTIEYFKQHTLPLVYNEYGYPRVQDKNTYIQAYEAFMEQYREEQRTQEQGNDNSSSSSSSSIEYIKPGVVVPGQAVQFAITPASNTTTNTGSISSSITQGAVFKQPISSTWWGETGSFDAKIVKKSIAFAKHQQTRVTAKKHAGKGTTTGSTGSNNSKDTNTTSKNTSKNTNSAQQQQQQQQQQKQPKTPQQGKPTQSNTSKNTQHKSNNTNTNTNTNTVKTMNTTLASKPTVKKIFGG